MAALLVWIPLIPLLSSLLLLLAGRRLGERLAALFGVGSVALSGLCRIGAGISKSRLAGFRFSRS